MNDEQIVEYCRNLIIGNLNQYADRPHIVVEIMELKDKSNKELLKGHCKGVIELLEKCIEILDKK